jgi:hypothetical protein
MYIVHLYNIGVWHREEREGTWESLVISAIAIRMWSAVLYCWNAYKILFVDSDKRKPSRLVLGKGKGNP